MQKDLSKIIGEIITGIFVGPEEIDVILSTASGKFMSGRTSGDCCSESWWADIVGVKQILGAKVVSIEQIDIDAPDDDRNRQEVDEAYCFKLKTNLGECEFIFRNSSNGYYGGSCDWDFVDHVPDDYTRVTENWRA